MRLPETAGAQLAVTIAETLQRHGYEAFFVGGCVRDMLLNQQPKDYDLATNALPEQVIELFPKAVAVGAAFGVVKVVQNQAMVEVATYRIDGPYLDQRRPDWIRYASAREDAHRRDFTINALFAHPLTGEVVDYVGGVADLKNRVLRTVGNPEERYQEDALRLLRAVRFASNLQLDIETNTWKALKTCGPFLSRISPERIMDELTKGLIRPYPGAFLRQLYASGLLAMVLPELLPMVGCEQPPDWHPEGDVFVHTALVLDHLPPEPSIRLAWAALLHDVGKPACRTVEPDGRMRFFGHERVGAEMVEPLAKRLHWSRELREEVAFMVKRHMDWPNLPKMKASTLRRWLTHPTIEDELALHYGDVMASCQILDAYEFGKTALANLHSGEEGPPSLPRPLLNGREVMAIAGRSGGPWLKVLLSQMIDAQMEGTLSSREEATVWLREKIKSLQEPSAN
jgi:poly(A) polymerase